MRCPVCRNHLQKATTLHTNGFNEGITECSVCGAIWSTNHGFTEIVADPQVESFLEAQTEPVECDDYSLGNDS